MKLVNNNKNRTEPDLFFGGGSVLRNDRIKTDSGSRRSRK